MLEPIIAQLQQKLFQSLFSNIFSNIFSKQTGGAWAGGGYRFKARASEFDALFEETAQKYGLNPALLKAVAQSESNFSTLAVSKAGAKGLMQLTDATARQLGVQNVFDPAQNVDGGARYLKQMLQRFNGDTSLALAAYNAGPGAVEKWGGLPPYSETQAYVPRVLDLSNQYNGNDWTA
jgi:soluble lytic murein transglycosylase-like protein